MGETFNFYKKFDLRELSKEKLLGNVELAVGLARDNEDFWEHPLAQDVEVLGLQGGRVAKWLAFYSEKNRWAKTPAAQDLSILALDKGGVAVDLACGFKNGWAMTDAAQDPEVLKLSRGQVALWLADRSAWNGWAKTKAAHDPKILSLRSGNVAKRLASRFPKNEWGKTVFEEKDVGEKMSENGEYIEKNDSYSM